MVFLINAGDIGRAVVDLDAEIDDACGVGLKDEWDHIHHECYSTDDVRFLADVFGAFGVYIGAGFVEPFALFNEVSFGSAYRLEVGFEALAIDWGSVLQERFGLRDEAIEDTFVETELLSLFCDLFGTSSQEEFGEEL